MEDSRQRRLMRLAWLVLIVGTIANLGEFALAVTVQQGVMLPLVVLALFDAATIAYVFMHVTQIWNPEE